MKGPPKVGLNSRSAPGPISAKKGMYSSSISSKTPPTMQKALRHQLLRKPFTPLFSVAAVRICAKILLLLSTKNRANTGRYTKNCPNLALLKPRKKGQI